MSDDVNPGYVLGQLARALTTTQSHDDPAVRARAAERVERWQKVLSGLLDRSLEVGSRTPVAGAPEWATLEVLKGGFATGNLLAAGELQSHEEELLAQVGGSGRAELNAYYVSDQGLRELSALLQSGCYRVNLPEEGALLVLAWLVGQGEGEAAHQLLDTLIPYFDRLRFYPVPSTRALVPSAVVRLRSVGETVEDLKKVRVPVQVARMNEALTVWAPLSDRAVALFAETVEDGWPCRKYSEGWNQRARALLADYDRARAAHPLCKKPDRPRENFARLRGYAERILIDPATLSGRDVGMIRKILLSVRAPEKLAEVRARQALDAARPTSLHLSAELVERLRDRSSLSSLEGFTEFPAHLMRKLLRCLEAPIAELVEKGVITSSEVIARVLPQITSQVAAAGIADPRLRILHGAIYAAFRQRRSLLLLNLEHQVQLDELPWVAALQPFRGAGLDEQGRARQTLEQLVLLAVASFPYVILPNKLLQEIGAMSKAAGLALPLVEEVAADIFMGTFSEKYLRAAQTAVRLLEQSCYERYYGVPAVRVLTLNDFEKKWGVKTSPGFAALCVELAGAKVGKGSPVAYNGTIIEQEQILTTHNLAVLFDALQLPVSHLQLAQDCFTWVCRQQQLARKQWKARLQMIKNTAYAWRQMLFFLSLAPSRDGFLEFASAHFAKQRPAFRQRFFPAFNGLRHVLNGGRFDSRGHTHTDEGPARRFLGWTTEHHWLLPAA